MNKKIVLLGIIFSFLLAMPKVSVFATEQVTQETGKNLLNELIDRQLNSITTGKLISVDDIVMDTEEMQIYKAFMEWRVAESIAFSTSYSDYSFDISDYTVSEDGLSATAYLNVNVTYANGAGEGCYANCLQEIKFVQTEDGLKIAGFSSEEEIMCDFLEFYGQRKEYEKNDEILLVNMINELDSMVVEMNSVALNASSAEASIDESAKTSINVMATGSCTYNATNGVAYANKYATNANPCFKELDSDCTNFVSQCVWAAYGGWSSGNETTMATLIANRTYMMSSSSPSNWFGHANGVSDPWGSVTNFWNFVTGNPATGPKATGSNNGGRYTGISYTSINPGDVLQIKAEGQDPYSGSNYAHSLYVVSNPKLNDVTYAAIVVAAHTGNGKFSLADKLATRPLMRKMIFTSATLNKP